MDEIFHKSTGIFDVVSMARPSNTPNRYDKDGHLVISYLDTEEHRRRSSVAAQGGASSAAQKGRLDAVENKPRAQHDEAFMLENGSSSSNEKHEL